MKSVTISNREIATMAFDRLCKENKTDAAIRLAHAMLHSQSICLELGDMEWDIDPPSRNAVVNRGQTTADILHASISHGKRRCRNTDTAA